MSYCVYNVNRLPLSLRLGKHMETGAVDIGIDCTPWLEDHPDMTIVGYHIPPGGTADDNYPVYAERVGNVLVWHVNREDTAKVGIGTLEIIGTAAGVEDVSNSCKTCIQPRMTTVSAVIPEGGSSWAVNAVSQTAANATAAQAAQAAAEDAASKYPIIGEGGSWLLWDWEQGAYVDSGVKAQGPEGQPGEPGKPGATGLTPDLQIGKVETLAPGSSATASITGTPEKPLLNLGIPQGAEGEGGGGSGCECVAATDEEILAALMEAGALPAMAVDGSLLAVDDGILIV